MRFEVADGSIAHCLLVGLDGRPYGVYTVFDAVGLDFGDAAEVMRPCLKADAPTVEVEFPNGSRRRYRDVDGAKRAIRRAVASGDRYH